MFEIVVPEEKDMFNIRQVFYQTWLETYPNEKLRITRDDIEDKFKDYFTKEALADGWDKLKHSETRTMLLAK